MQLFNSYFIMNFGMVCQCQQVWDLLYTLFYRYHNLWKCTTFFNTFKSLEYNQFALYGNTNMIHLNNPYLFARSIG